MSCFITGKSCTSESFKDCSGCDAKKLWGDVGRLNGELADLRAKILDWAARMDCCASANWMIVQEMGKEAGK